MEKEMRLKKTLYAVVMFMAVAGMVLPSVNAGIPGSRPFSRNRNFAEGHRAQLIQAQRDHLNKPRTARGNQKGLANNGLLMTGQNAIERALANGPMQVETNVKVNAASKVGANLMAQITSTAPVRISPEMRKTLQIRDQSAPSETASSRQARLAKRFAEAKRGLVRGGGSAETVLPSPLIAEESSPSALAFVGLSGTEDFFDEAVLLADLDGTHNLENDFDTSVGPRTLIDRQAKIEDDVLLPDEVYTVTAISGHNSTQGFNAPGLDVNVYYTATSAGFINILGDTVCDGDSFADTVIGVLSATQLTGVGGVPFSNSASITGLAVNTDSEYDGDIASDEIVWFTIFDPEFGQTGASVSALCFMLDSDGDDIPDPLGAGVFATSSSAMIAGVAIDSYGDVYFQTTNFATGTIFKIYDADEDRLPDIAFVPYNAVTNLDLANAANAVDIAIDRSNSVYLQVSGGIGRPVNTGLPSMVVSYIDRCGDFDQILGVIPRPDHFADTPFRIYAADDDVAQPAGAGDPTPVLVIPDMQIDYAGAYRGLAADLDDNIYVAAGAVPAGQAGDPSPFTGEIYRIPDNNCDRVGDAIDLNGNSTYGESNDYLWMDSPLNPPELTPNGINSIEFGPLVSLQRAAINLGDDDGIAFTFDDLDGPSNHVAGGITDLVRAGCAVTPQGGVGNVVGFEFLMCNTAFTGFHLGSNGVITLGSPFPAGSDPIITNFSAINPVNFLSAPSPVIAPLWTDLTPGGGGQFSIHRVGFAATDAFIVQWHNMPAFGLGGVGVGLDALGFPTRGNTNSFDVTFYDDQDAWDDVVAEEEQGGTNDTTNTDQTVNNDDDGISFPQAVGLRPQDPTRLLNRNGDGDLTDENLASFAQEGVGRTVPEQGPFKFVYHQIEVVGAGDRNNDGDTADVGESPVIVGFTTGFDGVFNTGTIPPGLCETNLSAATPEDDNPFFMNGAIGMGTEPSLYEFFNSGSFGGLNPDGTITAPQIDVDLRQEIPADCLTRPELFIDDVSVECLLFKGSNIPVGLFCQDISVTAVGGNTDPFLGPANLQISGFLFPMPTTGENAICPQFCGQTAPLCRGGKTVTYDVVFKFDEDGDGVVDATISFAEPDVVVVDENTINLTIDFSQTTLCGGDVDVCVTATYGFGDDNKYFEIRGGVATVQLQCIDAADLGVRAPVVLSIAPDAVDCDDPDDPDNVEDVQIAGLCFLGNITSAFLTLNPDGSGTQIPLSNVIHVATNIITATVPLAQLTQRDTPYYVFVVRGDGVRSTDYPNPLGFDVTFVCTMGTPPVVGPTLTTCRAIRNSEGKFILQVNGVGFKLNDTIVLLNGTPCRKNKYPSRFINPSDGTTTRINCSGGLKQLLPATVTTRNQSDGLESTNSLQCDLP